MPPRVQLRVRYPPVRDARQPVARHLAESHLEEPDDDAAHEARGADAEDAALGDVPRLGLATVQPVDAVEREELGRRKRRVEEDELQGAAAEGGERRDENRVDEERNRQLPAESLDRAVLD